jgi:hypothetical protein
MTTKLRPASLCLAFTLSLTPALAQAAQRTLVDSDQNGLIEINDLADLNEIRNNPDATRTSELTGTHLYGSNQGCPAAGCNGYELTSDLDFDSNGNQQLDAGDLFWNDGKGFEPIGNFSLKFSAEFHGNDHIINNLVMRRAGDHFTALFGYLEMAEVHHLSLRADIEGGGNSAALAGYAWNSHFHHITADTAVIGSDSSDAGCGAFCDARSVGGLIGSGEELSISQILLQTDVTSLNETGGLAGYLADSHIDEAGVRAQVAGDRDSGGLVGRMVQTSGTSSVIDSSIKRSFVAAQVNGDNRVGVLAGSLKNTQVSDILITGSIGISDRVYVRAGAVTGTMDSGTTNHLLATVTLPVDTTNERFIGAISGDSANLLLADISATYIAADLAGRNKGSAHGLLLPNQYFELSHIQCASDSNLCDGLQYSGWQTVVNSNNESLWQFGGQSEAPALKLPMATLQDADGNGEVDDWPAFSGEELPDPDPVVPDPVDPDPVDPEPEQPRKRSGGGAMLWWLALGIALIRRRV